MTKVISELYNYRQLLKTTILKDFRGKYKKSFFGVLWSFINPLLQLAVYSLVFPFIMRIQEENYTMFLFVALVPWTFFTSSIAQCTNCIVYNGGIIKKVYFPREILPIAAVANGAINFLISCIIIFAALIISGIGFSVYALYLPFILLVQCMITLALSFILSAITVYIRDLEYFINILLMLWMYLTPIVYPSSLIPEKFLPIFNLNPMMHIITSYRNILYYKTAPDLPGLSVVLGIGTVCMVLCYLVFKKLEKRFAEEI